MKNFTGRIIRYGLLITALSSIFFLGGIVLVLMSNAFPVFKVVGFLEFILGIDWYPAYDPPDYGIFPLIMGSFWVTGGAILIAVPLGVGGAVFLSQVLPFSFKSVIKPIVEILAGIPSVVYGFFGIKFLAPWLVRIFDLPTGLNITTAAITLGIMALPTVLSISEDAISSVPGEYKDAALALGATRWETTRSVLLPASSSGILTATILGISRSIGETMTVLMVAGGAAIVPRSIFDPVRPMPAAIAAEMGETAVGSPHYHALFGIGLVLFTITFAFNLLAYYTTRNFKGRGN